MHLRQEAYDSLLSSASENEKGWFFKFIVLLFPLVSCNSDSFFFSLFLFSHLFLVILIPSFLSFFLSFFLFFLETELVELRATIKKLRDEVNSLQEEKRNQSEQKASTSTKEKQLKQNMVEMEKQYTVCKKFTKYSISFPPHQRRSYSFSRIFCHRRAQSIHCVQRLQR